MKKEKVESKKLMREMNVDDVRAFPIQSLETVRNNVSILNSKHFREGKRWESNSDREEGVVWVKRVS